MDMVIRGLCEWSAKRKERCCVIYSMTDDLGIVNKSGDRAIIAIRYLIDLLCLHGINANCASTLGIIGFGCQSVLSCTYRVSLAVDMNSGQ